MLLLMSVGYVCGLLGWVNLDAKRFLSQFVVNIAVPCTCITGLLNNLSHDMLGEMGHMVVSALVGVGLTMLLSVLLVIPLKLPKELGCVRGNGGLVQYAVYRASAVYAVVRRTGCALCDAVLYGKYHVFTDHRPELDRTLRRPGGK